MPVKAPRETDNIRAEQPGIDVEALGTRRGTKKEECPWEYICSPLIQGQSSSPSWTENGLDGQSQQSEHKQHVVGRRKVVVTSEDGNKRKLGKNEQD